MSQDQYILSGDDVRRSPSDTTGPVGTVIISSIASNFTLIGSKELSGAPEALDDAEYLDCRP